MPEKLLAVIPARGGSKRIPKKNIRELLGRPMIAYTIDAALESGLFEKVIVSTDCPEIAEVSKYCGAEVPFLREGNIADDHTPVSAATLDALNRIDSEGTYYGSICQLMANCPNRDSKDIAGSYKHFVDYGRKTQISVTKYGWLNPWWAMESEPGKTMRPVFEEKLKSRSQDLPNLFCPTGAIWWSTCDNLRQNKTFHSSDRTGYEISWQHAVDIDDYEDWELAEILLTLRQKS